MVCQRVLSYNLDLLDELLLHDAHLLSGNEGINRYYGTATT